MNRVILHNMTRLLLFIEGIILLIASMRTGRPTLGYVGVCAMLGGFLYVHVVNYVWGRRHG